MKINFLCRGLTWRGQGVDFSQAHKQEKTVTWYQGYRSERGLTQDEKDLLNLFTEDEWCDLIPYHTKVGVLKLTVKQTVVMFENYVLTGVWK